MESIRGHYKLAWGFFVVCFSIGAVFAGFNGLFVNEQTRLSEIQKQHDSEYKEAVDMYEQVLTEEGAYEKTYEPETIGTGSKTDLKEATKTFNDYLIKRDKSPDEKVSFLRSNNFLPKNYKATYPPTYAQLRNSSFTIKKTKMGEYFPENTILSSPTNTGADTAIILTYKNQKCELNLSTRKYVCDMEETKN